MIWKARLASRRVRFTWSRFWARTSLGRLVKAAAAFAVLCGLVAGSGYWLGSTAVGSVRAWTAGGLRQAAYRLARPLDREAAKAMVTSVLPPFDAPGLETASGAAWQRLSRSLARLVTGYDFASPRSLVEAEIGRLRAAEPAEALSRSLHRADLESAGDSGGAGERSAAGWSAGQAAAEEAGPEPALTESSLTGPGSTAPRSPASGGGRASAAERSDELLALLAAVDWGDEPLVLIVHSHTSESYVMDPPDPRADARHHIFNESDTGITRVGKALASKLEEVYGIRVIHSRRVHNWPSHWNAYVNSRETVQEILAEHPSIEIVLDIHRQGIENAVWATSVGGVDAVSVEVIYTTSQEFRYASHPNWKRNEAFAAVLARAMNRLHPGLLNRVTAVRDRRYNQDLHPHMLLLEVGNYLDREERAIAAARLLADAVALALYEIRQGAVEALVAPARVTPPQPPRSAPSSPPPRR